MSVDILIVDDERIICQGLKKLIEHLGLADLGSIRYAVSAQDALAIMEEKPPGIVLTDIRMPRVDGLELIRRMRAHGSTARVVILSGHDDFAYAREALRLGAVDYLLKPATSDTLRDLLGRMLQGMQEERRKRERESADQVHALSEEMDTLLSGLVPVALAAAATPARMAAGLDLATAELCERLPEGWHALASRLLGSPAASSQRYALGLTVSGKEPRRVVGTPVGAFAAGRSSVFVLAPDATEGGRAPVMGARDARSLVRAALELQLRATAAVLAHRGSACTDWAPPIQGLPDLDPREALQGGGLDPRVEAVVVLAIFAPGRDPPGPAPWEFADRASLVGWLDRAASGQGETGYIASARAWIAEHFRESVDLGSLARRLGLSYTYLSTLFKRECGKGFSEYLKEIRMKEARRLLETGHHAVQEVARRTGYRSPKQFSRAFREVHGVSPKRFQLRPRA